jgi:branched-chain amino acid aminotransferase
MIWLNGKLVRPEDARIDPQDRGFTLADGLFETLRSYEGRPFRLADHLERLSRSAAELAIPLPIDVPVIAEAVGEVLAANRLSIGDAAIRITLTRGTGPRGLIPPQDPRPSLLVSASPYAPLPELCSAAVVDIRRNEGSSLSRLKTLGYLDNVLAAVAAERRGADEAILLNNRGRVSGGARANLFALVDGRIVTPPIGDGVLPGIARRVVGEIAGALQLAVEEDPLLPGDLARAQEIWLTNSLFELRAVARLDDKPVPVGDLGARIRSDYRTMTRG